MHTATLILRYISTKVEHNIYGQAEAFPRLSLCIQMLWVVGSILESVALVMACAMIQERRCACQGFTHVIHSTDSFTIDLALDLKRDVGLDGG